MYQAYFEVHVLVHIKFMDFVELFIFVGKKLWFFDRKFRKPELSKNVQFFSSDNESFLVLNKMIFTDIFTHGKFIHICYIYFK